MAESLRDAMKSFDISPPVVEGSNRARDVAIYDSTDVGESVTRPHLRICGFRSKHYGKLARALLRSLLPADDD
eukprot:11168051-Lingulodinium_polyedra.AAC.1